MGSMPISSELLGFAQFPQFALASRMPDVIPSAARVIVGTGGSAGNSDELRQLPSVLIRPVKSEIFQASIDLPAIRTVSPAIFVDEGLVRPRHHRLSAPRPCRTGAPSGCGGIG